MAEYRSYNTGMAGSDIVEALQRAKAGGTVDQELANFETELQTTTAEVENARIDVDGVTHDTLGEAIREQVGDLKSEAEHLGIVGSYHFSKSTGTGGEVTKLYPIDGNAYEIVYTNPSNINKLDFYEFYTDGTNERIKRIESPSTAGTYVYTQSGDKTVDYLRVYVTYLSGETCSVDVLIANITAKKMLGINTDVKYYACDNVIGTSGHELTKLYPVSEKTYEIYSLGLVNCKLTLYEFKIGGGYTRLVSMPTNRSYHYIPASDADYLRVYLTIIDNSNAMSGRAVVMDYESVLTVPIKEDVSDDIATDYLLSKEFAAVRKFTVIGDSMASGYYKESSSGTQHDRNIPYSWPQIMAKMYGQTAQNASRSGATCASWWEDNYEQCRAMVTADNRSQVYIMALGTNDYKDIPDADITPAQIGSYADVNELDYTQNADSFWGNYCKILQYIHEIAPNAKIICCTIPQPRPNTAWKQTAIREICDYSLFTNYVALCDLEGLYNEMSNSPAMQAEMWQGHFTPVGYANSAEFLMYAFSKTIRSNLEMFVNLPQIPFDMPANEAGVNAVITANASSAVNITANPTYIDVVSGKYVEVGNYVYFNMLIKYVRANSGSLSNAITNLPPPLYDRFEYDEYGDTNIPFGGVLIHTDGWKIVGAHAVGDVRRLYGRYVKAT